MEKFSKQAMKATVRNRGNIERETEIDFILVLLGNTAGNAALLFDGFILSLMVLVGPSWCNGDAYGDGCRSVNYQFGGIHSSRSFRPKY
jgi:hypothetical protein